MLHADVSHEPIRNKPQSAITPPGPRHVARLREPTDPTVTKSTQPSLPPEYASYPKRFRNTQSDLGVRRKSKTRQSEKRPPPLALPEPRPVRYQGREPVGFSGRIVGIGRCKSIAKFKKILRPHKITKPTMFRRFRSKSETKPTGHSKVIGLPRFPP